MGAKGCGFEFHFSGAHLFGAIEDRPGRGIGLEEIMLELIFLLLVLSIIHLLLIPKDKTDRLKKITLY